MEDIDAARRRDEELYHTKEIERLDTDFRETRGSKAWYKINDGPNSADISNYGAW